MKKSICQLLTVFSTLLTIAIAALGCASVKVRKIPTPAQYSTWTDEQQAKADGMEGVRFYLPRPFVNVIDSFPIATDLYIADGVISPDGQNVIIKNVRSESPLGRFFVSPEKNGVIPGVDVPKESIGAPSEDDIKVMREMLGSRGPGATPHAGQGTDAAEAAAKLAEEAKKKAEGDAAAAKMAREEAQAGTTNAPGRAAVTDTGKNKRKVTNNNGAFAYQPLRGNLEIVYLPDFDEQYVVNSKAGLGNAQFELSLGQGWSLQGFDSLSDNSQLNKLMYELIGSAVDAAKAFATSGTSLGVDAIASAATKLASPHRGGIEAKDTPGTPVSLRLVVIYYSAKGLYPVIKPRELKGLPDYSFVLDLANRSRVGQALRAIQDPKLKAEIAVAEASQHRFTAPVYPYQYISFNTFRYMSVDVLTKNGLPFGALYPERGTANSPGSGSDSSSGAGAPGGSPGSLSPKQEADLLKEIGGFLNGKTNNVSGKITNDLAADNDLKDIKPAGLKLEPIKAKDGKHYAIKATLFVSDIPPEAKLAELKSLISVAVKDIVGKDTTNKVDSDEVEVEVRKVGN